MAEDIAVRMTDRALIEWNFDSREN